MLLSKLANFNTEISSQSVVLAFAFSAAVGVIFGVWPARRAAEIRPDHGAAIRIGSWRIATLGRTTDDISGRLNAVKREEAVLHLALWCQVSE